MISQLSVRTAPDTPVGPSASAPGRHLRPARAATGCLQHPLPRRACRRLAGRGRQHLRRAGVQEPEQLHLYGYPGVALDAGVPVTQVGLAAAEDPATPRERVTLGPYGTADALLRIGSDLGQHVVGRGKGSGHDLGRLGLRAGLQEAVRAVSVPVRKMATTV